MLLSAAALLLTLSAVSTAGAEEVTIATGYTFIKTVFDPIKSAFRDQTGIDIQIIYKDPVHALTELEKGGVDAAGASMTIEDWLNVADKEGVAVKEIGAYGSYVPAVEKLMIMVNAGNGIKTLSKEQLKGIFTGEVVNWKDVGGNDAPILVVWPSLSSGALVIFRTRILDNMPITKKIYDVESIADTPDAIAATPEAIGIVTGTKAEKGLKEIAPPIERPLTLLYRKKPSQNMQKLLDFLKGEGKQYLK